MSRVPVELCIIGDLLSPVSPMIFGCGTGAYMLMSGKGSGGGTNKPITGSQPTPSPIFVTTKQGVTIRIPGGWISSPVRNGRGLLFQRPGSVHPDGNTIRIMDANDL
jgi:hypothetical protein